MNFLHVSTLWKRGARNLKSSLQSSLALWGPCKQAGYEKQGLLKISEMPHALALDQASYSHSCIGLAKSNRCLSIACARCVEIASR